MAVRLPLVSASLTAGIAAGYVTELGSIPPLAWLGAAVAVIAAGARLRGQSVQVVAVFFAAGLALAASERLEAQRAEHRGIAAGAADSRVDRIVGTVQHAAPGRFFDLDVGPPLSARVRVFSRHEPRVREGDRVEVRGRLRRPGGYRVPGASDSGRAAAARGLTWEISAAPDSIRVDRAPGPWRHPPSRVREAIADRIADRAGDARGNAAVRAMTIGDRSGLTETVVRPFRAAGLSHVLAVSGLHLAAVAFVMFAVVRRLWVAIPSLCLRVSADRAAAAVAIATAISYTLVTGARPSTVRAGIAACVVLVGFAFRRRARALDAIAVAALIMLVGHPAGLFDPSFQLSFAAATTLAVVFDRRRRSGWFRSLAAASAWATVATAPIVIGLFGEFPPASILANVIAVPIVELVVLPLAFAGVLLGLAIEPVGGVFIDVAVAIAGTVAEFAELVATTLPPIRVSPLDAFEMACGLVAVAMAVVAYRSSALRSRVVAAAVVAVVAAASWRVWTAEIRPRVSTDLVVSFLDVGQGDAAVLEFPGGQVWLVDAGGIASGGPELSAVPGRRAVLAYLRHRRIDHIDVAVISHRHPDHYAGLRALVGQVSIGEVWMTPGSAPPDLAFSLGALGTTGTRVRAPVVGVPVSAGGARVIALGPGPEHSPALRDSDASENDNSLVLRVDYAGKRILFLGDVERDAEEQLVESGGSLRADVVKVAHHGSRTSSTEPLVRATGADTAVISCGRHNRFGFPNPEVLAAWRSIGADVARTDRDGTIQVTVAEDGQIAVEGTPR